MNSNQEVTIDFSNMNVIKGENVLNEGKRIPREKKVIEKKEEKNDIKQEPEKQDK